jgi:capsular exopolysaccharide synthesis family protein
MTTESMPDQALVPSRPRNAAVMSSAPLTKVHDDIVMLSDPAGARAEAIRALRTHIVAQHLWKGRRALAVCGASEGVGCTFTAANLAVALSQVGVSTLLIDANLRRPSIERLFSTPRPSAGGLSQCLARDALGFSQYVVPGVLDQLTVMFAGDPASNAHELLGSSPFELLMQSCMRDFEVTIVDTPPANAYSDARRISSVVGYGLIVARKDVSLVEDIKMLVRELTVDHAQVVGTVLNEF